MMMPSAMPSARPLSIILARGQLFLPSASPLRVARFQLVLSTFVQCTKGIHIRHTYKAYIYGIHVRHTYTAYISGIRIGQT
jgi:hypothetical protein